MGKKSGNATMADYYKFKAQEYEAEKAANSAKIERLKTAKTSLKAALEEYETFKKNVGKLESKIDSSNFKGDIRDDFKKKIEAAEKSVNSDINAHEKNLSAISGKISELEGRNGNLVGWIANAWDSFTSFLDSTH